MFDRLRFASLVALVAVAVSLTLDRGPAAAQARPASIDDPDYASMDARDLYLDRLDYLAEPAPEPAPSDFPLSMQSRRQDPSDIVVEAVTIELNDPALSTHEQRSGFSLTSPID